MSLLFPASSSSWPRPPSSSARPLYLPLSRFFFCHRFCFFPSLPPPATSIAPPQGEPTSPSLFHHPREPQPEFTRSPLLFPPSSSASTKRQPLTLFLLRDCQTYVRRSSMLVRAEPNKCPTSFNPTQLHAQAALLDSCFAAALVASVQWRAVAARCSGDRE